MQDEFNYKSSYWTNKATYAFQDGLEGLTDKQTKLASYWNTPFNKICLGMKASDNITRWIAIDYEARSLYHVIANETLQKTNAGRANWASLINVGPFLHANCNKEGFNVQSVFNQPDYMHVRIGIVASDDDNCINFDSFIGFGAIIHRNAWARISHTTCGNVEINVVGNSLHLWNIATYGYILVQ